MCGYGVFCGEGVKQTRVCWFPWVELGELLARKRMLPLLSWGPRLRFAAGVLCGEVNDVIMAHLSSRRRKGHLGSAAWYAVLRSGLFDVWEGRLGE